MGTLDDPFELMPRRYIQVVPVASQKFKILPVEIWNIHHGRDTKSLKHVIDGVGHLAGFE